MAQCNILSFTIMAQYYRKNWEDLCCWLPPAQTYDGFVTGLTETYNDSCLKDRVFSDYVTRLFNECLTGSSSDGIYVTGGTANGTNDTLVFTNNSGGTFTVANSALLFNDAYVSGGTLDTGTGCVTFVNTSGGTFQVCGFDGFKSYWSANTFGIVNSGLTGNVGIGTATPNKPLTVVGDISGTTALYLGRSDIFISGETQANGDLSLHSDDDIELYSGDDIVLNTDCRVKFTYLNHDAPGIEFELEDSPGNCRIMNGQENTVIVIYSGDSRLYFGDIGGEWISGDTTDLTIASGNDIMLNATADIVLDTAGGNIELKDGGTLALTIDIDTTPGDAIFKDAGSTEIFRIDGSEDSLLMDTTRKIQFRDTGLYIHSSVDGQLDIAADTALLLTSPYVGVGNAATGPGEIRFYEDTDDGAHYAALKTGALGGSYTLTLPTDDGDSGEVLSTDGNGVLSWAEAGGGGGTSYWTANTYGIANSGLTTTRVGIGTATPSALLEVDNYISFPEQGTTFVGYRAGEQYTSGQIDNTAVGYLALGYAAMTDAADSNTAIGFASLGGVTTASKNTGLGVQSSYGCTTGIGNTAVGFGTALHATYHSYNVSVGYEALLFTVSGSLGKTVLNDTFNVAIGYRSQYQSFDGAYNTSVGAKTMTGAISIAGTGNTAMGMSALNDIQTGSWNTTLGYQAGDNITTGDYNISIGPNSDPPSATADYQMNIGGIIFGKDPYGESKIGNVGIGYNDPKTVLDVHHRGNDLTSMAIGTGGGEVIYFGINDPDGEQPLGAGKLMYLDVDFNWKWADANAVATGGYQLLAIALGTTVEEGLLIRGFFSCVAARLEGTYDEGLPCYISEEAGAIDFTAPSAESAVVRVVGYAISPVSDELRVIYFTPDNTWVELS